MRRPPPLQELERVGDDHRQAGRRHRVPGRRRRLELPELLDEGLVVLARGDARLPEDDS